MEMRQKIMLIQSNTFILNEPGFDCSIKLSTVKTNESSTNLNKPDDL